MPSLKPNGTLTSPVHAVKCRLTGRHAGLWDGQMGWWTLLSRFLLGGIGSTVSVARPLAAQPTTSPIVTAVFPDYSPVDWHRYEIPEMCHRAVMRVIDSVQFDVVSDTVSEAARRFAPILPVATVLTHQCLARFDRSQLPSYSVPTVFQMAVAISDTALAQAMIARQVAGAPVPVRAAMLDTAVWWLLQGKDGHVTPAKAQLARTLVAQIGALGPAAIHAQQSAQDRIREFEVTTHLDTIQGQIVLVQDFDVDKRLAYVQEQLQKNMNQQQSPGTLSKDERESLPLLHEFLTLDIEFLKFLKTGSDHDFEQWQEHSRILRVSFLGPQAPRLMGTYWFNVRAKEAAPTVPIPGKVNIIVFLNGNLDIQWTKPGYVSKLHHLLRRYPDLQVTVVAQTQGSFQGLFLMGHPAQEAELIHQYLTDSVGFPGILVVDTGIYQKLPNGNVYNNPSDNMKNYRDEFREGLAGVVVDPKGRIVVGNFLNLDEAEQQVIIRRLETLQSSARPAASSLPGLSASKIPKPTQ